MKKFASFALILALAASFSIFAVSATEEAASETEAYGYVNVAVKEGECEVVDNSETNYQADNYPVSITEGYGTGRTTQGDAVQFPQVTFNKPITSVSVKCGIWPTAENPDVYTEFWVYFNRIEGEPVAKISVSGTETKTSKIVDQVWKTATIAPIAAGTYDVFVVSETENSGSFSEVNFAYEGINLDEAMAQKEADDIARAEAEKKAAEEEAARQAIEAAKKAAEEAAKAEEDANATQNTDGETDGAVAEAGVPVYVWVIIGVVVAAAIAAVIVVIKKKK